MSSYVPPSEPVWPFVSAFDWRYGVSMALTVPASGAYEAADGAAYFPVFLPSVVVARRLWWVNGATVSASYNIDVGIYADAGRKPGAKIISTGSTAQGNASEVQFVDITDTVLTPGRYWLAIACSSTSATFFRAAVVNAAEDALSGFRESSAQPLPATATPIERSSINIYHFGFATTASP